MPKIFKTVSPIKAEMVSTINTVIETVRAVLARSCLRQPSVALIKIGIMPMGFTIANRAMVVFSKYAQSVSSLACLSKCLSKELV